MHSYNISLVVDLFDDPIVVVLIMHCILIYTFGA
jgi:hypothetical protein